MASDLEALSTAVANLRKSKKQEPMPGFDAWECNAALWEVANEYLREHDPTPVDVRWAEGLDCPETMRFCHVTLMQDNTFRLRVNEQQSNRTATRGDVRSLARIMGIDLREPT